MWRALFLPLLYVWFVLSGVIAYAAPSAAPPSSVKIGLIVSLTGPAAENGRNWMRGAELAAQELGRAGTPVTLIVEDDQTSPSIVARAFQKLAQIDRVQAIVGGTWDYLAQTAYPLAQQYKIPFITPTNPIELFQPAERENHFVFTNAFSIAAVESEFERLLVREKVKTLAIVCSDIPWGHAHAAMARKVAARRGIKLVYETNFPLEAYPSNLKMISLQLSQRNPDAVLVTFDYNGIDLITAEFSRLRINPLLIDTQHLHTAFAFSKDPARHVNAFGMYPVVNDTGFAQRYRARYSEEPPVFAAEGYDAVGFLAAALRSLPAVTRASSFGYQGLLGEYRLPSRDGVLAHAAVQIMTTRSGRFAPMGNSNEAQNQAQN